MLTILVILSFCHISVTIWIRLSRERSQRKNGGNLAFGAYKIIGPRPLRGGVCPALGYYVHVDRNFIWFWTTASYIFYVCVYVYIMDQKVKDAALRKP